MSLRGAAHLLAQSAISGAPVIDAMGRCIGVISTTDFVFWAEKGKPTQRANVDYSCAHCSWQVIDPQGVSEESVSQYMTTQVVTISPETSIGQMARMMTDAHIHRLIVVDCESRPVGIVSSTDIVAAVARASKEEVPCTVPSSCR